MAYHVVLSRFIDFSEIENEARENLRPRHAMKQLADRLGATIHFPGQQNGSIGDRLRSQFIGRPDLWQLARELSSNLSSDDVVYCPDEQIGLPLAALCSGKVSRPALAIMVHNVDRPRTRAALRFWPACRSADVFVSVSNRQLSFLRDYAAIEERRTVFVPDQTDLNFFQPSPLGTSRTKRPILVSAGLEKRDYAVLAEAVRGLDVDVRITGFSADSARGSSTFPQTWPENFTRRRYEWPELAQLYKDSSIVVVTLRPNIYAAGVTTLVEGMATARPIIVTKTEGLEGYLDDTDALVTTPPGDSKALRATIIELLEAPARAAAMGRRAAEIAAERYGSDKHVETLASLLSSIASAR